MIWAALLCFVAALVLIAFALKKKDYVRASFSLRPFGFFIEAKNAEGSSERKLPR
jgi:hypothetical protein